MDLGSIFLLCVIFLKFMIFLLLFLKCMFFRLLLSKMHDFLAAFSYIGHAAVHIGQLLRHRARPTTHKQTKWIPKKKKKNQWYHATVWNKQMGTVWTLTLFRGYNFWTNDLIFILKTSALPFTCLAKGMFLFRTCINVWLTSYKLMKSVRFFYYSDLISSHCRC